MQDALRIIDANFNRAREAMRVMEEYVRFCLDDAALTYACKTLRHDLVNVICSLQLRIETGTLAGGDHPPTQKGVATHDCENVLVAARDTVGDVGTGITCRGEKDRRDVVDVALAGFKRASEALRSIEEYGKLIDSKVAARVEQLRYETYKLERLFALTVRARARFAKVRLYVLITEAFCKNDWFETSRLALEHGADCIQLREKNLPDAELLRRARRLARLCRDAGKLLVINDRPDIALASGAHGVHLGQDDMDVTSARRILPPHIFVGLSTHTEKQVDAAIGQAPDYIAVGPMFSSETKSQDRIAGYDVLARARGKTALPLAAIGGLNASRAGEVIARADCFVCVCSSIISHSDVVSATEDLRAAIDAAWQLREDG